MAKGQRQSDILLHSIFSFAWSMKLATSKKESMSKRLSVWGLPPSYDQENLRGIHGPQISIAFNSLKNTLSFIQCGEFRITEYKSLYSYSDLSKKIYSNKRI